VNRPANPNKHAADIINMAADIASGRGRLGLANSLWGFERELREEGRAVVDEEMAARKRQKEDG
jgi:hypothetical protein